MWFDYERPRRASRPKLHESARPLPLAQKEEFAKLPKPVRRCPLSFASVVEGAIPTPNESSFQVEPLGLRGVSAPYL